MDQSKETTPTSNGEPRQTSELPPLPRSIIVADDEHLVATGMAGSIRELGFTVIGPAADGEEVIEMCRTSRPDLALLDIRMPKKNGLATAEVLYRQFGIPVVIFSAYSDREYVEAGNRVGVFGYLLKPVTQDQLRVGVSVAWGRFIDAASSDHEITRLRERLEDRKIVERAKWVVVQRKGITEPEAMRLLQRQARNNRRPLAELCRGILENEELFAG
ncbi:MAG: response regulator [Phycisphaerales bacterium]|nr:response regulator [Phycisphaerae bacterium]NNF45090.1 response regulator [Phycisphaerales bacterium]NNM25132.1 response regulator [Phycisphaerales bacterium]